MSRSHRRRSSFREFEVLKECFPSVLGPHEVDQDWTGITSDTRRHIEDRMFFLGEIFGGRSRGKEAHEVGGEPWDARLGIVTRKQSRPYLPVEMAPEMKFESEEHWVFSVAAKGLAGERRFLPFYRRPVYRCEIGRHVATIGPADKARLAEEMFGNF